MLLIIMLGTGIALLYNLPPNIQAVAEKLNRAIELKGEGEELVR